MWLHASRPFLADFSFLLDCWVVWAAGSHSIDFETSGFGVRTIAKFLNHWLGDVTIAKFSFAVICPDPGKILIQVIAVVKA